MAMRGVRLLLLWVLGAGMVAALPHTHRSNHTTRTHVTNIARHEVHSALTTLTDRAPLQKAQDIDFWAALSRLAEHLKNKFTERLIQNLQETGDKLSKEFTPEEKTKLNEAGLDLLTLLTDHELNDTQHILDDLHTVNQVVHPHLNQQQQNYLDLFQESVTKLINCFGAQQ